MMNLQDLMHTHESDIDFQVDSDAKQTYLPELREIDHHPEHLEDPFFDQPASLLLHSQSTESPPEEEPSSSVPSSKRTINKNRNETKNIPKNFGKGIISFIEKNQQRLSPIVARYGLSWNELVKQLRRLKQKINTIAELRDLWTGERGSCLRVLSNLFFRQYALEYIFNSRISSYGSHIKYRSSLWQALRQPQTFNSIKHY